MLSHGTRSELTQMVASGLIQNHEGYLVLPVRYWGIHILTAVRNIIVGVNLW